MRVRVSPSAPQGFLLNLEDFNFTLPQELIAFQPPTTRGLSKLLSVEVNFRDKSFDQFEDCLMDGDLLVLNDTKVIKARIRGRKETGAKVEILIERIISSFIAKAQTKSNSKLRDGDVIFLEGSGTKVIIEEKKDYLYQLRFSEPVREILESQGEVPLPPYIKRSTVTLDEERYQTVYADSEKDNSVAAPTAGLHFNKNHLKKLEQKGVNFTKVTLDIGLGTFQPIKTDNVEEHIIHKEIISVNEDAVDLINEAKKEGRRVVAIGTTVLRALEGSASIHNGILSAYQGETDIFIYPGFKFKVVDALLTNFHLPKSSLFLLVSAFGGSKRIMEAYLHAINKNYKFFSYGDAMFIKLDHDR